MNYGLLTLENQNSITESFCYAAEVIKQEFVNAAFQQQRPSVLYRPTLAVDGNQWCALYGANLHDGFAGFGDSPDEAMRNFDDNWIEKLPTKEKG